MRTVPSIEACTIAPPPTPEMLNLIRFASPLTVCNEDDAREMAGPLEIDLG